MLGKENDKSINKILFIVLLVLILILIIIYKLANWQDETMIKSKLNSPDEVANKYIIALYEKDYEELSKYLDYDGIITYISLYNNWSYNIAEDWDEIFELSQTSGIVENMKVEVEKIFKEQLCLKNEEIENLEFEIIEKIETIEESENLFKITIRVTYKNEGFNYDDEIYLRIVDGNAYIVASKFIEDIAELCENTLITEEYTIKKSLDYIINNIVYNNEKLSRSNINSNLYDFRFCTKDSAVKDISVYTDEKELIAGDKIYLADLYAQDDDNYFEVTLAEIDGVLCVGEIIEIESY